jgi:chromosome segregation ATPase
MSPNPNLLDLPVPPSPELTKLQENFAQIERDAEAARQKLEAAVEQAKANQRRLDALNRTVDDASDQLLRADEQLRQCKAAAAQIRNAMPAQWGTGHVDGSTYRPPDYSALVALDASIADFPRVRAALEQRLSEAQTNLTNFQRENNL